MTKINLSDLSFFYQRQKKIVHNLNLQLPIGALSLLIGPTGCGKSTLLKIIAGIYPKYGGKMTGKIERHNLTYAMMFQNPSEQFTMATPRQEIIFALENLQLNHDEYERRLKDAVVFTQISKLLDQKITTLSGGEKQRVALAVLIAMNVDLFLLDEPFASVDPEARSFLIKKLAQLRDQGKTIIITDHVFNDYGPVCDQVFEFQGPTIVKLNQAQKAALFKPKRVTLHFPLPSEKETAVFNLNQTKIAQQRTLLAQDQLKIYQGKSTLITGVNGIGKTSFFKALTKMLPYTGHITFNDQEVSGWKAQRYLTHVAQIFQSASDQFLAVTVQDELNLSKKDRNHYFTDEKIKQALEQLDLTDHLHQVVYSLSGGQQKKLQILLMLMTKHEILLIDEPLAGLDANSVKQVLALMQESQQALQQTFLIISHQIAELSDFCDYHLQFAQRKLQYVSEVQHES
ncbi:MULTISPECIES: ATP-binding cassette domain-containing protein [Lactobacillus]|uniref:ABC transporter ATP-binding protein n=1 Tax=Lactobacillus xujianguonis TaxID=2495899 RepID=A0A437SVZ4_9LACO|nr:MULTISPECIES: ABC transporter ATP-binding protein [Lactobacillus]RVU71083.1 ABC transporter ATP-binding protein [Lactobacillus xujianguonis]RVU76761.1 ABC transporter ATP-binding protein [Lactobacillus xujianguonis]